MSRQTPVSPTGGLRALGAAFEIGAPDVAGPLAVFPLFPVNSAPPPSFVSLAAAIEAGAKLTEHPSGIALENPLDAPVLVYAGEEAAGAGAFEETMLAPARGRRVLSLMCVEAGRKGGAALSPRAAYPALRRLADALARAGLDDTTRQAEVRRDVKRKAGRAGVRSATTHDIFEQRRPGLARLTYAMRPRPGQAGALVSIAGAFVVLDAVASAEAWSELYPRLLQGYALDALDASRASTPSQADARDFVDSVLELACVARPATGMGTELVFQSAEVAGSALALGDRLVALTAFAAPRPERREAVDGPFVRCSR